MTNLLLLSFLDFLYTSVSWTIRSGEGESRYDGSQAGLWEIEENEESLSYAAPKGVR